MKLNARFYLWFVFAVFVTHLVHEAGHWLMAAALGMDPTFGLNGVKYLAAKTDLQRALADAAGPLVTIVQAILTYVLVMRDASHKAFAFLYAAAFMRLVAGLISLIFPNDEARISLYLGMGKWALPVIVAAGLVVLAVKGGRRLGLGWKDHLLCYLVASLATSAIVALDRFVF